MAPKGGNAEANAKCCPLECEGAHKLGGCWRWRLPTHAYNACRDAACLSSMGKPGAQGARRARLRAATTALAPPRAAPKPAFSARQRAGGGREGGALSGSCARAARPWPAPCCRAAGGATEWGRSQSTKQAMRVLGVVSPAGRLHTRPTKNIRGGMGSGPHALLARARCQGSWWHNRLAGGSRGAGAGLPHSRRTRARHHSRQTMGHGCGQGVSRVLV